MKLNYWMIGMCQRTIIFGMLKFICGMELNDMGVHSNAFAKSMKLIAKTPACYVPPIFTMVWKQRKFVFILVDQHGLTVQHIVDILAEHKPSGY
jgi:hypothetical protein